MSTTIHIPNDLLAVLDKKVKELHLNRNRYICMVLRKELVNDWPESFRKKKFSQTIQLIKAVDEMMKTVKSERKNKKGISF